MENLETVDNAMIIKFFISYEMKYFCVAFLFSPSGSVPMCCGFDAEQSDAFVEILVVMGFNKKFDLIIPK